MLLILIPVATAMPALISLAIAVVLIWAMIAYEHRGYGEGRDQLRHEVRRRPATLRTSELPRHASDFGILREP